MCCYVHEEKLQKALLSASLSPSDAQAVSPSSLSQAEAQVYIEPLHPEIAELDGYRSPWLVQAKKEAPPAKTGQVENNRGVGI
jgi:hypothetical protein